MPKLVKAKKISVEEARNTRQMTAREISDAVEAIRVDLLAVSKRLNDLSWDLALHGVKSGRPKETYDYDIPF